MKISETVLVVPPNDAEAVMIQRLAQALNMPMILSSQKHGARLEEEKGLLEAIKKGGWKTVVIVEMPGPRVEARLRAKGIRVIVIDHHHYTGLDRASDKNGKMLPSSLEQFLRLTNLTDAKLRALGFEPLLVRGIGIKDRGFVWALFDEGYSKKEVARVLAYSDSLIAHLSNPKEEARKNAIVNAAWKRRVRWGMFWIVESRANISIRPRLSHLLARSIGRPLPVIIIERGRGLIYVQESPYAMALFRAFGGFTFGMDHNWGAKTHGETRITLTDVKRVINEQ